MRILLLVSAIIEAGAGSALLCCPSAAAAILLGSGLDSAAAVAVGRVAGAALLALGVACWMARCDASSRAARGLVAGMTLYNLGAVVILGAAGILSRPVGVALWPAVVLHVAMTGWCITCLFAGRDQVHE